MNEHTWRRVIGWALPQLVHPDTAHPDTTHPDTIHPDTTEDGSVLDGRTWDDLTTSATEERVAGLVWQAVENGLAVTPMQRVAAAAMAHDAMVSVVGLEAVAQWAIEVIEAGGVDVRLIKGLATAHVVHVTPELRDSGDVDLLVAPADFQQAARALSRAGLCPQTRWGDGASGFLKEQVFTTSDGVEIDLHQSLNYGERWRRLTPRLMDGGLNVGSTETGLGPRFTTLNIEGLFISAAVSASRSDVRLSGLLDVAVLSHDARLDADRLTVMLDAMGLGPAVAPVLDRAARYFAIGATASSAVAKSRSNTLTRALARVERSDSGARYVYSCLSGSPTQWSPGMRALLAPDDAHFDDDPRRGRRLRRVASQSVAVLTPSSWRQTP